MFGSTVPLQSGGEPGQSSGPPLRHCRLLYDSVPALFPGHVPPALQAQLRFTSADGQDFDAVLTDILTGLLSQHVVASRMAYLIAKSTALTHLVANGIVAATPVDSASSPPSTAEDYVASSHMVIAWTKYCAERDGHTAEFAAPVAVFLAQRLVTVIHRLPTPPQGFLSPPQIQLELHYALDCIQWARPPLAPTPSASPLDHTMPDATTSPTRPAPTPSTSETARRAQQWAYQATAPQSGTFHGGPSESYISFKNDMLRMKMVHNFDTLAFYYYTLRYLGGVALREAQKVLALPDDANTLPVTRVWSRLDALYMNSTAVRNVITTYSEQRQTTTEAVDDFLTRFEYTLIDYEATVGVDLTDDQKIGQLLSAVRPELRDELTMRRDTTCMNYATFRSAVQSIGRILDKRRQNLPSATTSTSSGVPPPLHDDPYGPTNFRVTSSTTNRSHRRNLGQPKGCYRCYAPGHRAAVCTAPEPAQKSQRCLVCGSTQHKAKACTRREQLTCKRCHKKGHSDSICLSTKSPTALQATALSDDHDSDANIDVDCGLAFVTYLHAPAEPCTRQAVSLQTAPPEPRLTVTLGESSSPSRPTISVLLDTGATTGLIGKTYVDRLITKKVIPPSRLTTIDPVVITYGNGSQAHTTIEVCLPLSLTLDGHTHEVHLLVVSGIKPAMVFGRSVLKQLRVNLRYAPSKSTNAHPPVDVSASGTPDSAQRPSGSSPPHQTPLAAPSATAAPSTASHLQATVALPSWATLDPGLHVHEVLDSTDWLVVACVSDGTARYIWCDIADLEVPTIAVPREHPKLTTASAAVREEAIRLVDDMVKVGKLAHPPPGLEVRAITNYYPVVGKRVRPVFPSLQVNRGLTRLLRTIRFRQSPLIELKAGLRTCVHAISMDVQDAFMQLRVGLGLQRYLGLHHRHQTLVFTRVPYGLAISPHILEVAVRHVVKHLVLEGVLSNCQITALHYMDDVFLLSTRNLSPDEIALITGRVTDLFAGYSLPMSPKKTVILFDTVKVNALGLEYTDYGKFVRFPLPRWQAIYHIEPDRVWTYRGVLSHLGQLTAESDVLPEHCLEQRNLLQGLLAAERHRLHKGWNDVISKSLGTLLTEWLSLYQEYDKPPSLYRHIDPSLPTTIYTDASRYALAYKVYQGGHLVLQGQRVLRKRTERALHANVLELCAVYFALSRVVLYESIARVHYSNPADSATRSPLTEKLLNHYDTPFETPTRNPDNLSTCSATVTSLVQRAAVLQVLPMPWISTSLVEAIQDYRRLRRLFNALRPASATSLLPDDLCFFRARQQESTRLSAYGAFLSGTTPSTGRSASLVSATRHLVLSPSGLLYRHVLYDVYGQIVPQVVLDDDDHTTLIQDIIHHFHCLGGHPGIKATRHLIERYFWSPKLRHAVRRYIQLCQPCLLTQQTRPWHPPSTYAAPSKPFQTIGLDLTGPYHSAVWHTANFRVVLTATDLLTKYSILIPLQNGSLPEVLHGVRLITWTYGVPSTIVCDNAKVFVSLTFARFLQEYGIKVYHTPPLSPFYGGWFERVHRTMGMVLRRLLLARPTDWLTLLPETQWIINHVRQQEYGACPHELLFGYTDNLHFLHMASDSGTDLEPTNPVEKHVINHKRLLAEFCRLWENQHTATRLALERRATTGPQPRQGDTVYRFRPAAYKLTTGWDGPYTILDKLTDVVYLLSDPRDSSTTLREHIHNLYVLPACGDGIPQQQSPPGGQSTTVHDEIASDVGPVTQKPSPVRRCDLFKVNEVIIFTKGTSTYVGQVMSISPNCYVVHLLAPDTDGSWQFKWIDSATGTTCVAAAQPAAQAEGVLMDVPFVLKLKRFTLTPTRGTTRSSTALLREFKYSDN